MCLPRGRHALEAGAAIGHGGRAWIELTIELVSVLS
eukprot:CAMPEP_0202833088 /NCGR_PEP_ID=MMETSP1389-20130828/23125_1 /ASSEMBLY_ACC=CAM_ASM_000865 /TAXON_ID=302021 /ORGANISM="Rhodomonas sp., Strain CCMP768" /LENGTH=35 /DNA_ID= /DNA_START= /DNA_END= /DNA_ORIENTATION=